MWLVIWFFDLLSSNHHLSYPTSITHCRVHDPELCITSNFILSPHLKCISNNPGLSLNTPAHLCRNLQCNDSSIFTNLRSIDHYIFPLFINLLCLFVSFSTLDSMTHFYYHCLENILTPFSLSCLSSCLDA